MSKLGFKSGAIPDLSFPGKGSLGLCTFSKSHKHTYRKNQGRQVLTDHIPVCDLLCSPPPCWHTAGVRRHPLGETGDQVLGALGCVLLSAEEDVRGNTANNSVWHLKLWEEDSEGERRLRCSCFSVCCVQSTPYLCVSNQTFPSVPLILHSFILK